MSKYAIMENDFDFNQLLQKWVSLLVVTCFCCKFFIGE